MSVWDKIALKLQVSFITSNTLKNGYFYVFRAYSRFFITFAVRKRDCMPRNMTKRKTEQLMIFAASCVESAARAENMSSSDMYKRMKRVGLIEGFIIKCYEGLHTQSRQHVTEDVLGALAIWEAKKGVCA